MPPRMTAGPPSDHAPLRVAVRNVRQLTASVSWMPLARVIHDVHGVQQREQQPGQHAGDE